MTRILKNEDWLAFFAGLIIVLSAWAGIFFTAPKFGWSDSDSLNGLFMNFSNIKALIATGILLILTALLTFFLRQKNFITLVGAISFMFLISVVSLVIAGFKPIKYYGFEYVIFGLLLGIAIRNVFGLPKWIEENLHTEFFVKTGLVVLGSGIIFGDIIKAGSLGLIQAVVVVLAVWFFAYWIAKKLKVDDELSLMLSSAVSICGVSAAIATAGAIKGDSKKLSYVVSLVLLIALPMLILMPLAAKYLGLNPAQAGAWFGGTIDTTGAVVASGTLLGDEALKYSTIIKFSQNVLIGFAAVAISIYWVLKEKREIQNSETKQVNFRLIWDRFPKFVLGFIAVSLIYSFLVPAAEVAVTKDYLKSIQTAFFALAFVGIGLETDFSLLIKTGNGRPAWAFVIAQVFNIIFTLGVSYFLFSKL